MTHYTFKTVEDWCEALNVFQSVAFLPAKLAAESLNTSPSAISKQLKAGKIPSITIGDRQYVAASYVREAAREYRDLVDLVYFRLEDVAERGEKIFYGELMEGIGLTWRSPPNRLKIAHILASVSRKSYDRDGILLSSIVHRKSAEPTTTGPGYFYLIDELREEFEDDATFGDADSDPDELLADHMKAVWKHYARKGKTS